MKYYKIATKMNKLLLYTKMGRNLKKPNLNEISHTYKIVALVVWFNLCKV